MMFPFLFVGIFLLFVSHGECVTFSQFEGKRRCPDSLTKKCSCFWKPRSRQFITNCSNAELTSVPDNIPLNTTHLLLNDNIFHELRNKSFEKLVELQLLDLSNCHIYQMEALAFQGLQNLEILYLKNNHLNEKNNSYAHGVFTMLAEKLNVLDIRGNLKKNSENRYPVEALSVLNALKTLRLDCISGLKLDREFGNLTSLKELDFSGGIQADYLPDDMFSSISKLDVKTINFSNANILQASEQVFSTAKSLRVLDFTNNPRAGESMIQISSTLDQTCIEQLYLENTCLGLKTPSQEIILNEVLVNLSKTKTKILSLDRNVIHDMKSVFHYIQSIETLTITNNRLYDYDRFFYNFTAAVNLTKLDISFQSLVPEPPTCESLYQSKKIKPVHQFVNFDFFSNRMAWPFKWPEKLEWFVLSNANGFKMKKAPEIAFMNNGSIKYVDASGNHFETFPSPFYCRNESPLVISTLEHLDASNCAVKCVNKDLFGHCEWHLRFANFSHNELGLFEGDCNNKDPMDTLLSMRPLTTLEALDLSYNSFTILLNNSFDTLVNLKKLFMSHNKLSTWEPNLSNSVYLEYLDLSYNNFKTLPLDTRLMLNQLDNNHFQATSEHLFLNLLENKISCSCQDTQFLEWMRGTKINFAEFEQYVCQFIDGTQVELFHNLNTIITELESECSSNIWLVGCISALAIHFTLVTMATVMYRFRHFLKYLILKMRMRRERLDALLGNNNEYLFDAFISCTREGAKWAKRYLLPRLENQETGLKFCVAQRDFLVGKTIIDNIMDTISKSRKTILLVDETFIDSKWCQEELLLSHHESLSRGYNMIICIFMPEIIVSERHLPPRVNMLRHQVTCIKWPRDPAAQQVFWLQVERALLHNKFKDRHFVNM